MTFSDRTLENIVVEAATAARPALRLTVSEAAEMYRKLNNPGAYVGPWKNDVTPYLKEPMDVLNSRDYTGMIFVGPAQTGKTDMALNYLLHSAKCDPADLMIIQTTQTVARDFSQRRINRLHRHSPEIGDLVIPASDNTYDKTYTTGMLFSMSWPTIKELSGKPIPRLWLTDYDRMPMDIDGEGSPYFLAKKRATTFRRNGMCAAESSPGFIVDDPRWTRQTKHEAPPTQGILSLYNQGDRRMWYWLCLDCHLPFEPDFELLVYDDVDKDKDAMLVAEEAYLGCPHCGSIYTHDPVGSRPGKGGMNKLAKWVPDNCQWDASHGIIGDKIRTDIASFWLKGVAAAFADWRTLVYNYVQAEKDYERTGDESNLKTTVNTDQGKAYTPKLLGTNRVPDELKGRAKDYGIRRVPLRVRFLVATIDVQKNRFVVQVHGIAADGDMYIIDRFDIVKSKRVDPEGDVLYVNPGAYKEDWKVLVEAVMDKSYELNDTSGRRMGVKFTMSDSGGKEGVTANAYDFYRWLRNGDSDDQIEDEGEYSWSPGLAGKFLLLKGASSKEAPRAKVSYPDSQRKDRHAEARGEIPVLMINTNMVKDMIDHRLNRTTDGGRIHFPNWLDDNFYIELTVEIKDGTKGWINPKRFRNESWDLLAYCQAALLTNTIGLEHINWQDPPTWAAEWDENVLIFNPNEKDKAFDTGEKTMSLAQLAESLA